MSFKHILGEMNSSSLKFYKECKIYEFNMNGNVLLTYIEGGHHVKTSLTGLVVGVDATISEKLWNTFQAIGNIAFAYSFSTVIAEIQASIKFKRTKVYNRTRKVENKN